jgi:hypothetical protein
MRKRTAAEYVLTALAAEKVVQHAVVTWALAVNAGGIRETAVLDHRVLAVAGALAGMLFGLGGIATWRGLPWGPRLLLGLGAFDIIGEFLAQGRLDIHVTVSFVVAIAVVALSWRVMRRRPLARA